MSQTTFLETVVSWDQVTCRQNLDEAVPKLITYLQDTNIVQEQVGILKIICQSFLCCIDVLEAEQKIYRHVILPICRLYDELLTLVKERLFKGREGVTQLQEDVTSQLQLLLETLDCCETCVKFSLTCSGQLEWSGIQSLPSGVVHLLKETYTHCKDSGELYKDLLNAVSEPLASLFRKAHSLQVSFLNLLDKVCIIPQASDEEVYELSKVCHGLFEICQIVSSLDMKLVINLWKTISRHAVQKKELLKDRLEVDPMISYLCQEVESGYDHLFTLLPHTDYDGMVLSQGDEKGFQKSVKILGFQMKIIVMLTRDYVDYLTDCQRALFGLIIHLHRCVPPSLHAISMQEQHKHEIKQQLVNATEPLVTALVTNNGFMHCVTQTKLDFEDKDKYSYLCLLITVLDVLPKVPENVQVKWISPVLYPEDEPRTSLLTLLFQAIENCYVEVSLPLHLPAPMVGGKPQREVSLYEYICVHLCGFVGSLPEKVFPKLEQVLLENLLSTSTLCPVLASDVWCFLARYGTADLCYKHFLILLELSKQIHEFTIQRNNIVNLLRRLMKFLAEENQLSIVQNFPPDEDMSIWSDLPVGVLQNNLGRQIVSTLMSKCMQIMQDFINTTEVTASNVHKLSLGLKCLVNLQTNSDVWKNLVQSSVQSGISDRVMALWTTVTISSWLSAPVCKICLGRLILCSGNMVSTLNNSVILKILSIMSACLQQSPCDYIQLCVVHFLKHFGQAKLAGDFEQSKILQKLPIIFGDVLSSDDNLIRHSALMAFTQFAEETAHESVVPECMQRNNSVQETVVAFLNKIPHKLDTSIDRSEFLASNWNKSKLFMDENATDIVAEPLLKRQRMECTDNKEHMTFKHEDLIVVLKQCVSGLQSSMSQTDSLSKNLTSCLKSARDHISDILGDNG